MTDLIKIMQHVFTKGDPMEIHHQMAVAAAHFVPGFLEQVKITQEQMDEYDKWQSTKKGKYKVPDEVRKAGCH